MMWKDVIGYEGYYSVSDSGLVKSNAKIVSNPIHGTIFRKERILKPQRDTKGYCQVSLYIKDVKKIFMVHRLVAEVFIDNPQKLPFINHRDANKSNNDIKNLEWITNEDNMRHAVTSGIYRKKNIDNCRPIILYKDRFWSTFESVVDAGSFIGVSSGSIGNVLNGSRKNIRGYKAFYV